MAGIPLARQFHGTCRLVRVQLNRLGESYDLDANFSAARERHKINLEDELFIRSCFALDERYEAGENLDGLIDQPMLVRLQQCAASKLNMGDSA